MMGTAVMSFLGYKDISFRQGHTISDKTNPFKEPERRLTKAEKDAQAKAMTKRVATSFFGESVIFD